MRRRSHFTPGLLQGIYHFVIVGFLRQLTKLPLQEYQAERIFQDSALRISGKLLFQIKVLDFNYEALGVTHFAENLSRFLRVKSFQGFPPLQVTWTRHRVGFTGHSPAAKVLTARR